MQLHEIRKQLKFSHEFLQLVEMMKNIAGQQYHALEKEKLRFGDFMDAFSKFFRVIDLVDIDDPLVRPQSDVLGLVMLTSDSGFMGGLNSGVIRQALEQESGLTPDKVSLIVIGDKGAGTITDMNRPFKHFSGIQQETIFEQALEVKNFLVQEVLEGRLGRVTITYPESLSFTAQRIQTVNLLPCAELFDKDADSEVAERVHHIGFIADARRVLVESSFEDIIEHLVGVWVEAKLFEIFEDGKLAEFSARAVHLEGSHQKLEEEFAKLRHQAFRAAHEQIDKGIRDGFAAKMSRDKRRQ
jgi:ATP synthase F1 gamma subunit